MFDIDRVPLPETSKNILRHLEGMCSGKVFLPTAPQADFLQELGHCPFHKKEPTIIFLSTSGNGTGKTTIMGNVVGNLGYSERLNKETNQYERVGPYNIFDYAKDVQSGKVYNGFFNTPFFKEFPEDWPRKIWCVSHPKTLSVVHDKYKEWWPNNMYSEFFSENKEGQQYVSKVKFTASRFEVLYKSTEQDLKVFESEDVAVIIFDEPPPSRVYHACISRLRSGGVIIIQATPLSIGAWFATEIMNKMGTDKDKWHQQVPVWTNVVETAGEWDMGVYGVHPKGNLKKVYIDGQIRNYKRDEIPARVEGKFLFLSDIIYSQYPKVRPQVFTDLDLHKRNPKIYNYRFVMDPHDRRPPFMCWLRMDPLGSVDVIAEWPTIREEYFQNSYYYEIKDAGEMGLRDFVRVQFEIESRLKIPADRIEDIIDPNFGVKIIRQKTGGKKWFQEYQEVASEYFQKNNKGRELNFITNVDDNLDNGHQAVREYLLPNIVGDHSFLIGSDCENIDLSMLNYKIKGVSAKKEDEDGQGTKPEEKFKDPCDVVRYGLVLPWDYNPLPKRLMSGTDYEEPLYGTDSTTNIPDWKKRLIALERGRPTGSTPRPKGF